MTSHRTCGDCTLCCRLIPVESMGKLANQKCKHQSHKGCTIYADRPTDCRVWSCGWLRGYDVGARPDRSHAIVDDQMPSSVAIVEDGKRTPFYALQVWCDPRHPDAHEDPTLRAWLAEECAKRRALVIVRYSSSEGFVLFPPWTSPDGKWTARDSNVLPEGDPRVISDHRELGIPVL